MEAIRESQKSFQLKVIEDAAQAIGAECPFDCGLRQAGTMARSAALASIHRRIWEQPATPE